MSESRVAVYFCHEREDALRAIDLPELGLFTASLPGVLFVENRGRRPRLDPERLAQQIRGERVTRVVVAGDRPGYFKAAFTRAMDLAGADPAEVRLASFEEHAGQAGGATARARAAVACAVCGIAYGLAAEPPSVKEVHPATLVIGAGVAGIAAALEIADAGRPVWLVERTGTIGGHMAQFDRTFPTLDCAACSLTPRMVAIARDRNVRLLTCTEVRRVTGEPGAYHVTLERRARRVDADACVTCHLCRDACPVDVPSEFECGLTTRKAIYMPFPQAVPTAYLVDPDACTYVTSAGQDCGACRDACPEHCVHLDEQDELLAIDVGNIIVATGFDAFDAARVERYGYGRYPNVMSALEFERLTNASGPTGGRIEVKVHGAEGPVVPKTVAIVHCVGSRDQRYQRYCSRICCMYSLKFAQLVREKLPAARCYEFYIDMRAFGKGYEAFFERTKHEGVYVVRGRSATVVEKDGTLVLKGEDILSEQVLEFPVDLVVLAVGLQPARGADELGRMLGITRDDDGWFSEWDYNTDPTGTERGGVYVAGVCQGPKDISDSVSQAAAVAARVLKSIATGKGMGSHDSFPPTAIETRARSLSRERDREAT